MESLIFNGAWSYYPGEGTMNYSLAQVVLRAWWERSSGRVEITDSPIDYLVGAGIGKAIGKGFVRATARRSTAKIAAKAVPNGKFYSVAYEMQLGAKSYPGVSRYMHFKEANISLNAAMKTNPVLSKLGISVPRSQAGSIIGKSPSGWVWHHNTSKGVMQLVPKSQHPNIPGGIFWETMHPGGHSRQSKHLCFCKPIRKAI